MEARYINDGSSVFKSFLVLVFLFIVAAFLVPARADVAANISTTLPTVVKICGSYYVVNAGDTLGAIAARCGVTEQDLLAANPVILNPNSLFIGQELRIPGASDYTVVIPVTGQETTTDTSVGIGGASDLTPLTSVGVAPATEQYIVQPGDTLGRIANGHNVTLQAILAVNPAILDEDVIDAGQVILIPID